MAGSVGTVYYDVLPNLDGFASKVAAGVGKQKPVKIAVEADTKSAEASAKRLTGVQVKEAQLSSRQRMALIQRDAIAENRFRDRAVTATKRASAQKMALIQRDAIAENRLRDRAAATTERNAARQIAAQAKIAASQQKAAAAAAAQQKAAKSSATGSLGSGLLVGGAATIAALGGIVKVTADFDQAVSGVAATGKEARASISQLRAEAIKYGADTSFSAKEAANAQEELIKANVSVTDTVNGGLKGALDLAAAGSLGVADAAGIMGTALSQFKLDGTQASHVADLLAAGAGKAQGEVQDFAEALKYVGPNAQAAGVGIEETVGTLAMFADQGVLGSQAGTSLRSMLVSLTAPAGAGAKAMAEYGINVRDASGEFVGFEGAAAELRDELGNLGQAERDAALARIFGKNSLTAATILYEGGAAGVKQWTDAVNESGFAQDVARTKMNNLKGDVEKLGGAFQSAFIETGSGSMGGLRTITQGITGVVEAYSKLPEAGKSAVFIGTGLAAAAALGAGGVIKLVGVANEAKIALAGLGISAKTAGIAAGGIGAGIAVAAAVVGHFAIKSAEAAQRTDDLTQALLTSKGAIDGNIASMRAKSLEDTGALQAAQKLGISIEDITQASLGNAGAQDRVTEALKRAQAAGDTTANSAAAQSSAYNSNAKAIGLVSEAVRGGAKELTAAQAAYERQSAAQKAAASGTTAFVSSLKDQQTAAVASVSALGELEGKPGKLGTDSVNSLTTALWGNATAALAAVDAELAYEEAVDQAATAAKKNKGKGTDKGSDVGRENARALRNEAAASQTLIDSYIKQGKGAKKVGEVTADARKQFVKNATAMTGSSKEANRLADKYGLIPKKVETKVETQIKADKAAKIAKLESSLKGLPKSIQTEVKTLVKAGKFDEAKAKVKQYKKSLDQIPKTKNVDAKVKPTGVPKTQRDIKGIKGTSVNALVRDKGVGPTQRKIMSIKGKAVTVVVGTSGIGASQRAINMIRGKQVTVTVKKVGVKDGGPYPQFADGGRVRGSGGPREDNIAIMDRATKQQIAWGSAGEFMTNARQYAKNKEIVETINAGGTWDIVPRRAEGGPIGGSVKGSAASSSGRPLILNIDMGDLGIRRIVTEIVEDRDEYSASVGRMH